MHAVFKSDVSQAVYLSSSERAACSEHSEVAQVQGNFGMPILCQASHSCRVLTDDKVEQSASWSWESPKQSSLRSLKLAGVAQVHCSAG